MSAFKLPILLSLLLSQVATTSYTYKTVWLCETWTLAIPEHLEAYSDRCVKYLYVMQVSGYRDSAYNSESCNWTRCMVDELRECGFSVQMHK